MENERTIAERIDAAFIDIAAAKFEKNKTVEGTGPKYKFIPISDILDTVRKAHAKHGVKVFFGQIEYDAENGESRGQFVKESTYGKTMWNIANGHVRVTLMGKGPEDVIETVVNCEAMDNSDKLTNKLYTNAERALYRTLYAIDEGDGTDPEATHEEMTVAAEPPKREVKAPRATEPKADPFFQKKTTAKTGANATTPTRDTSEAHIPSPAPAAADHPSDSDKLDFIMDMGNDPKIKRMINEFKAQKDASSVYSLSAQDRNELYEMVKSVV